MQWHAMTAHSWPRPISTALKTLAQQAEKTHDAEAMAFVALRAPNESESTKLADEAVQLDPKLVWIYAMAHPKPSEAGLWIKKLEQFDPQNALPHFIEAENIDIAQSLSGKTSHTQENPAWQTAMASAFRSAKLDDYHHQLKALDRRVAGRYNFVGPYEVIGGECDFCLPSYTASDSSHYAKSALESGEMLEAQGDRKGALEKYLAAVRFGQMMKSPGGVLRNRLLGIVMDRFLKENYQRLASLYQKQGENEQAELYALLARKIDQSQEDYCILARQEAAGNAITRWNASVVQASGLLMPVSAALLLICALAVVVRNRSLRLRTLHAGRGTLALGLCGAVGLLVSSAILYVSYRPYAEIFQQFVRTGNDRQIPEFTEFLSYTQTPLGAQGFQNQANFVFYFWFGVSALSVIALLFVLIRHIAHHHRAAVTT
jgi:tetratricopeptide (TPR) repeat protein